MPRSPGAGASSFRVGPARLACVGVCLILGACAEEAPEPSQPLVRPVKTLVLGAADAGGALEYPGQVAAAQNAEVSFEAAGGIIEFPVKEGQSVSAGQLLARLDPADFQSRLDSEIARQNAAGAAYERIRGLYESGAASAQDLDVARRDKEVIDAAVQTARKALNETRLVAPFDGVVARTLVDNFTNVNAKQSVLVLQDNSTLEIQVDVPERDWAMVRGRLTTEGGESRYRLRVTVSTYPDRQFEAALKELATTADPTTRTYRVTLSFDPPADIRIMPGMTARVAASPMADTAPGGPAYIPANATGADSSGEPFVWRVDPQTMQVSKVYVALGELSGDSVAVLSGLSEGDEIAITGVSQLAEGMTVRRLAPP